MVTTTPSQMTTGHRRTTRRPMDTTPTATETAKQYIVEAAKQHTEATRCHPHHRSTGGLSEMWGGDRHLARGFGIQRLLDKQKSPTTKNRQLGEESCLRPSVPCPTKQAAAWRALRLPAKFPNSNRPTPRVPERQATEQETAQRTSTATPADISGSHVTIADRSSLGSAGASRTSRIRVKPGGTSVCARRKAK